LWVESPDGDAKLCPCLKDADAGDPERQVLPVSGLDEVFQDRIVKGFPPFTVNRRCRFNAMVIGFPADVAG